MTDAIVLSRLSRDADVGMQAAIDRKSSIATHYSPSFLLGTSSLGVDPRLGVWLARCT